MSRMWRHDLLALASGKAFLGSWWGGCNAVLRFCNLRLYNSVFSTIYRHHNDLRYEAHAFVKLGPRFLKV